MPGRLFLTRPLPEIEAELTSSGVESIAPRRNIAPGQELLVQPDAGGLQMMRWGLIPVGRKNARGRPVLETIVNARSETVFAKSAFEGVRRAIVPADGWYEWTGEKRKKTAWRIRPKDGSLLAFAAIWDVWHAPGGVELAQVATVTCEPSLDVRDIHHRMGVLLPQDARDIWLHGTEDEAAAVALPLPEGSLVVEKATDVDWSAP